MIVADIMNREINALPPSASLQKITEYIKTYHFDIVPIEDKNHLMGVVTSHDIISFVADGGDLKSTPACDLLSHELCHVEESLDIFKAQKIMLQNHTDQLLVLDEKKHVCGVVKLADIVQHQNDMETEQNPPTHFFKR